jgi:hypothetical protein
MKAAKYVTRFDSSWGLLVALSRYLQGKGFPGAGVLPSARPLAWAISHLGSRTVGTAYSYEGATEAVSVIDLAKVNAEAIARDVVRQYPSGPYPAIFIGSSNGAAVHLCASLGVPWLPQTFLIAVRHPKMDVDEPVKYMRWAEEPAKILLKNNPELQLHQMHDPAQDRLMSQRMAYFRLKRTRLGQSFKDFMKANLLPGATIFLLECNFYWPATTVGERHFFQTGGFGGVTPDEYINCGGRIEEFLKRERSTRSCWDSPKPDSFQPEAEWGFQTSLREDVELFARENNYHVRRIAFTDPEDLSPLVADLYRWWYEQRGVQSNRLLVECFNIIEPWWALRIGAVPFWLVFNMEPSVSSLERYLSSATPYDFIHLVLFSHGVEGPGLVPLERWHSILRRATIEGKFLGVNEKKYPKDMAVFIRYDGELQKIPVRYPMPEPLTLEQLSRFLSERKQNYAVSFP